MLLTFFVSYSKTTAADCDAENWEVRFLFDQAISERVFMFLPVFFQVAHVEIFFVTTLNGTHVLLSPVPIFKVNLNMLLEICCRRERFAAGLTDEGLFLCMYALVPIQIRLLVEPLVTILIVAFIGFNSLVNEFMPF